MPEIAPAAASRVTCQFCKTWTHGANYDRCIRCRIAAGIIKLCDRCKSGYHDPKYPCCKDCKLKVS